MENEKIVKKLKSIFGDIYRVEKISGDASSRMYFRGIGASNNVIISVDNINSLQNKDFQKASNCLHNKIRIPEVLYVSEDFTFLVQEDVGITTFLEEISILEKNEKKALLRQAVDDIFKYQSIEISEFKKYSTYEFNDEKLNFEIELSNNYFVQKYLSHHIDESVYQSFKNIIMTEFRDNKSVVCHRDYHSRNLMIKEKEIIHIDYQDARIGPLAYDLVSLLEDCYIEYTEDIKNDIIDYFIDTIRLEKRTFMKHYHKIAIQRLFKALGSFAYLKLEKNKPQYEKYISKTFERLRYHLEQNIEFNEFRIKLCRAYYEN